MKARLLVILSVFSAALLPLQAGAQKMNEIHKLDFGVLGVPSSDMSQSVTVTPDNQTLASGGIVISQNGHCGEYSFTGLPPNTAFYVAVENPAPSDGGVVIDNPSTVMGPGGDSFTIDGFQIDNGGIMQTDGGGNAHLCYGATLHTPMGVMQPYASGTYSGSVQFTFYY